jgi:hypothetical protein
MVNKKTVSVLFICLFSQVVFAQIFKQGMVSYKISYPNLAESMRDQELYLPTNMYLLMKGDKRRVELKTVMGPKILLIDDNLKISYMLSELMGKKLAQSVTVTDQQNFSGMFKRQLGIQRSELKRTPSDTKMILGYKCQRVDIVYFFAQGEIVITGYYTDKIKPVFNAAFHNYHEFEIGGLLLEYEVLEQGYIAKFIATDIEAKELEQELFELGEDYTIIESPKR